MQGIPANEMECLLLSWLKLSDAHLCEHETAGLQRLVYVGVGNVYSEVASFISITKSLLNTFNIGCEVYDIRFWAINRPQGDPGVTLCELDAKILTQWN